MKWALPICLFLVFSQKETSAIDFSKDVRPLLARLCFDCHGAETQKADLRLDTLNPDLIDGGDADTWHDVLDQINLGEMPPKKAKRHPATEERKILTDWLNSALKEAAEKKRLAGGRISSRRLTRYEYANTMRDLLGVEMDFAGELPPEAPSPEGFLNNGSILETSPTHLETFLSVARKALDIAIVEGEMPRQYSVRAEKTAVGKLPRKKDGGAVPVNPEFVLDISEFPRSGEFQLVIKAGAIVPPGKDFPKMRVSLGCVPGIIHVPRKLVGEVDVTAPPDNPETFVFRGRIENFPQSGDQSFGSAVEFKGMIGLIDFLDADGKELRYPHRRYSNPPPKPKKKGAKVPPLPPPPKGPLYDVVIDSFEFLAPVFDQWPPASHVALLGNDTKDESLRARRALDRFLPRAFRGLVSEREKDRYFSLFKECRQSADSFEGAIRETFAAVLVSPRFLNLIDTGDQFALANRLSYFLWSTMPDERLLELAKAAKLADPEILEGEVERLLDDSRTTEFANRFADQWFDLGGMDRVAVNPEFYPEFKNELKAAMRSESRKVLAEILKGDLSCLELLDSNWTMANRTLAIHYGLEARPRTGAFERVALSPEDRRGGILGQGAFLLSNSNGETSHPIKRAVWIRDRLLDDPPNPPPPDVPDLNAENADLAGLTLKQQLAVHREKESCNACHENIDPWGIALENFDATGLFRTEAPVRIGKKKKPTPPVLLDPLTELPNGTKLNGAAALKRYLLEKRRDAFARAVTNRLASYALGRSLDFGDREVMERLAKNFENHQLRLRGLILDLVKSELFNPISD